jgi:hypothetical protein
MKALLLLLPMVLVLAGCVNVRTKQLLGAESVDLSLPEESEGFSEIVGEWVDVDGVVALITVLDAEEGEVLYAPQTGDDDPTKVKLRRTDDYAFANFEMNEKGERTWMLMGADSDMNEIYLWTPDSKLFRKLIEEGKIKGTNDPKTKLDEEGKEVNVQNPGAVIDDPEGTWVAQMIAGELGVLVDWRHPRVLRRVLKEGDGETEEGDDEPEEVEGQSREDKVEGQR